MVRTFSRRLQFDFEMRVKRDISKQALKHLSDAVQQHPEIAATAHLYLSQVGTAATCAFRT